MKQKGGDIKLSFKVSDRTKQFHDEAFIRIIIL